MTQYLLNDPTRPVGLMDVTAPVYPTGSDVLRVGVGEQYTTIAAAVAAARDGDVILVDAGTYTNDFVHVTAKLTMIGVGGMVNLVATVACPDQKGIMTVDNDLTIENFTFTGAEVSDASGGNGAGIRYEAGNLVLENDGFYQNQNGLLANPGTGTITIDHSDFSDNGSGTGYTHNIYVGAIAQLTVTNSTFTDAQVGHELKSRAYNNILTNNLFSDGPTGTASYDIDLPNGGVDTVTNNVLEKGPDAQNNTMLHFGGEGLPYLNSSLTVTGNTFINDLGSNAIAITNATSIPVTVNANTFDNLQAANVLSGSGTLTGNVDGTGSPITNSTVNPFSGTGSQSFSDSLPHSVTLATPDEGARGGAGHLTVLATAGQIQAVGGSGGMTFSEGPNSSANQIQTAAGSTNTLTITGCDTLQSQGTDWISTAALSVTGTVTGTARIEDGTAFDQWTVSGSMVMNGRGGAPAVVVLSGGQATITGSLSGFNLSDNGGTVSVNVTQAGSTLAGEAIAFSITGGAASGSIYQGLVGLTTASGLQGATITLGAGTIAVTANGHDTIHAGSGADTVTVQGTGGASVYAGTGQLSVFGRGLTAGSGASVYGNGGSIIIDGDTGNITYYGGSKANTVTDRLGNTTLIGGTGRMTVYGGYSQTITGGTGGLTYIGGAASSGTVTTAAGSANTINLGTSLLAVNSFGNDVITGGNGGSLVVHGNATISGNTGYRTVTLMGRDVLNGVGQDNITVTAGANVTYTSGSSGQIAETGATVRATVTGADAATALVTGGAASISTNPASGISVTTTAGTSTSVSLAGQTALTTYGADQIRTGTGTANITLMSDNVQIIGGSGTVNVAPIYFPHTGLHFTAGTGTANLALWNEGGNDIVLGRGKTNVVTTGGAANTYEAFAGQGGGLDVISGFRVGTDHLLLHGVTIVSENVGNGVGNVTLSDNTRLQLQGVSDLTHLLS